MVWKPGQSGNAAGKPRGSKDKLQKLFVQALTRSFELKGIKAIDDAIEKDPGAYLKLIASILPKEFEFKNTTDEMTDEQLAESVAALRAGIAAGAFIQATGAAGIGQAGEDGSDRIH